MKTLGLEFEEFRMLLRFLLEVGGVLTMSCRQLVIFFKGSGHAVAFGNLGSILDALRSFLREQGMNMSVNIGLARVGGIHILRGRIPRQFSKHRAVIVKRFKI